MLPVGDAHCAGSVLKALAIAGVSFTTTVVVLCDEQFPKVAFTV